jgi:poly(A) polymerase
MKRVSANIDLGATAFGILQRLHEAGHDAYAVGGVVRDARLGLSAKEIDIATSARPEEIQTLFERTHPVGEAFGVILVVEAGEALEVASFRKDEGYVDGRHPSSISYGSLDDDARRRDFTVNALYYDARTKEILDPVGGLEDLKSKTLRAIGDPHRRFAEDHLRLLRCARFAAQLDFEIEELCWDALVGEASKIRNISAERIGAELTKLLTGPRPGQGLRILLYSGLLDCVLPEIVAMVGVRQPPEFHPEGDVFVHSCLALENLESRTQILAWAALLHDVGKPPTFRVAERIRFDGHVGRGMDMAKEILQRLRFDNESIKRIVELVHLHLKFADVFEMRASTLKRFLRTEHFDDHMALHRADCLASHGDLSLHDFCQAKLAELGEAELRPPPLLGGRDLLAMGYEAGPLLGEILGEIETAQLEGELHDEAAARAFVEKRWPL